LALAVSTTTAFACDQHKKAADAIDPKTAAVKGETTGCELPCCAHAKEGPDPKAAAVAKSDTPSATHAATACPKNAAATVAKSDPARETPKTDPAAEPPKVEPAADPETRR
jgi:hypothetical protein